LPGTPDIVLRKMKRVIFVHGCFWHGHTQCPKGKTRPKTRRDFWEKKISSNIVRDDRVVQQLKDRGWRTLTIWECELRNKDAVRSALSRFLKNRQINHGN